MKTSISINTTPSDEDCCQINNPFYFKEVKIEVIAFVSQIIRTFGQPPAGVRFEKIQNNHDEGPYYDIEISYDEDSEEQSSYALMVEANLPKNWDEQASKEISVMREIMYPPCSPSLKIAS